MASIKSNIILNGINTVAGLLFPIITFPYAARILMPEGIGIVNFQQSIINYVILFTCLGIPTYSIREIARKRDDIDQRNKFVFEIIYLQAILCIISYLAIWVIATYVPLVASNKSLFYILSLSIFFTAIGANWFYQGIEDFKFITIRGLVIRSIAVVLLYMLVKKTDDLIWYGAICTLGSVGNNIINFFHLRKYLSGSRLRFKELNPWQHIKPSLQVFAMNLIISLYVSLNSVMLGFMSGETAVGYFSAGTKISHMVLTMVTSVGAVLLPRCSNLVEQGQEPIFQSIVTKSLRLVCALSLPLMFGLMILAKPITLVFCGNNFMPSIPVLYWNAPIVLFVAITNVLGIQVLYAKGKTNLVIISVAIGAGINILLNILLIPFLSEIGTSIATFAAELSVLITQLVIVRPYFTVNLKQLHLPNYIIASMLMICTVIAVKLFFDTFLTQIILGILMGSIVYLTFLFSIKDALTFDLVEYTRHKNRH